MHACGLCDCLLLCSAQKTILCENGALFRDYRVWCVSVVLDVFVRVMPAFEIVCA